MARTGIVAGAQAIQIIVTVLLVAISAAVFVVATTHAVVKILGASEVTRMTRSAATSVPFEI